MEVYLFLGPLDPGLTVKKILSAYVRRHFRKGFDPIAYHRVTSFHSWWPVHGLRGGKLRDFLCVITIKVHRTQYQA